MVKLYKLKYNLPTFWKGDIAVLKEDGNLWFVGNEDPEIREKEKKLHWQDTFIMYNSRTLKNFGILGTYFEELPEELVHKLWPFEGCDYYFVDSGGRVAQTEWRGNDVDCGRKRLGNCYMSREGAEEAQRELEALCQLKGYGLTLDSFGVGNGKGGSTYLRCSHPEEYREEIIETLKDLMGFHDD